MTSRVHHKVKPHLCSLCGKSFPSTSTLRKHVDAVHEKKQYECKECDEIFKNKYAYDMHNDFKHKGKESFKCKICNAELLTKSSLTRHMQFSHEGRDLYIEKIRNFAITKIKVEKLCQS